MYLSNYGKNLQLLEILQYSLGVNNTNQNINHIPPLKDTCYCLNRNDFAFMDKYGISIQN